MIELRQAEFVARSAGDDVRVLYPTALSLVEPRIALIGANGSGKSTLARMLNGLVEPSGGSVRVAADGGRWLDTVRDGAAVRRRVGFVFTDPAAQLVMPTAVEDVALSLRRSLPRKAERLAAARAALARFGLEGLADRSVHSLSGGQQQLLAIAAVLAAEPAILVADEPTTLLDLRNTRLVADTLFGLPQQLIVATHDLDLAARCDRVLVVEEGRIARDSSASDCAASGDSAAEGSVEHAVERTIAWYRGRA